MKKICVVGLGYVGLPLAVELARKHNVIGFDINHKRIQELNNHYDSTKELSLDQVGKFLNKNIIYTNNENKLAEALIFT